MLINLKKWREEKIGEQAIEFVRKNPDIIKNWDQDALNKVIDGRLFNLEKKWNFLVDLGREKKTNKISKHQSDFFKDANIIHFVGSSKPWFFWINNPKKYVYLTYLKQSLWSTFLPQSILIQLGYIKNIILRKIKYH